MHAGIDPVNTKGSPGISVNQEKSTEALGQLFAEMQGSILELKRDKANIALAGNLIIGSLLVITVIGFWILNRQKHRYMVHQQAVLDALVKAEQDKEITQSQLRLFANHLEQTTNRVSELESQLALKKTVQENTVSQLTQHAILTESDWNNFRDLFEKVYPGFMHQLKVQSPDITLAELRMAALSKLQLSSREASNLLGISPNSVNKTKHRLRARLGLEPEVDLNGYFA